MRTSCRRPAAPRHLAHRHPRTCRAAIASTVSEADAREIVVETDQGQSGFLQSRRDHRALDPEGVTAADDGRAARPGARSGAGADAIKPFTLTSTMPAISTRMNDAIYRVTVDGTPAAKWSTRPRHRRPSSSSTAIGRRLRASRRHSRSSRRATSSTFGADGDDGRAAPEPGGPLGPGPRRRHRAPAAGVVLLAELQHRRHRRSPQRRQRRAPRARRASGTQRRAPSATPASTITTSSRCC